MNGGRAHTRAYTPDARDPGAPRTPHPPAEQGWTGRTLRQDGTLTPLNSLQTVSNPVMRLGWTSNPRVGQFRASGGILSNPTPICPTLPTPRVGQGEA
jgi:hypothetical protein